MTEQNIEGSALIRKRDVLKKEDEERLEAVLLISIKLDHQRYTTLQV
jgi:hypothetical protein